MQTRFFIATVWWVDPEMDGKIVMCHCLYQSWGVTRDFVGCNRLWKTDQVDTASLLLLSSWAKEDKWQVVTRRDVTCPVGTRGHFTQEKSLRQVRDVRKGLLMTIKKKKNQQKPTHLIECTMPFRGMENVKCVRSAENLPSRWKKPTLLSHSTKTLGKTLCSK